MCFCLCRLNQAVFLGGAKPWSNFPGIMQNCIGISMSLFPGLQVARKYPKMGLFSPPRYSIFSGDHGLLVYLCICLLVYLFICLLVYLFTCLCYLFIHLFVYLFMCLLFYLFICLLVDLLICLLVYLFICLLLFVQLFTCLFVYLLIC